MGVLARQAHGHAVRIIRCLYTTNQKEMGQRQTCKRCGCVDFFNFNVPDDIWAAVVPTDLARRVVCLKCFDELASEKGVKYAGHLRRLFFAGQAAVFQFEPVSAVDYT